MNPSATPRDIRTEQIDHGRRTLSVRPGQRRPDAPRKPFVAKGHDAILKQLQEEELPAEVTMMSGQTYLGVVVARDKYTITLKTQGSKLTIYKHAIESFGQAE